MKCKSIATIAVLALFLASSLFVINSVPGSDGTSNDNETTVSPIDIHNPYVAGDIPSDWGTHAKFDAETSTLVLEDINAKCDLNSTTNTIIRTELEMITIEIKGDVVLSATNAPTGAHTYAFYEGNLTDGTFKFVCDENSSLTIIPPECDGGYNAFGIYSVFTYMEGCNISFKYPTVNYGNCIAIEGYGIDIIGSDVTFECKYVEGMKYSIGILNSNVTNINNSTVKMTGVTRGITGHDRNGSIGGEMGGTCIITESIVTITCADGVTGAAGTNGSSIGLNLITLMATNSTITATGGTCKDAKGTQGASVGINTYSIVANGCIITASGKLWKGESTAYVSSGIEFYYNAEFIDCTLECSSEGGNRVELQSGIKSKYGLLRADNCDIVSNTTGSINDKNIGIGCHCNFNNCKVDSKGTDGAFYDQRFVSFENVSKLQGLGKDGKWVDITNDDVFDYKEIRCTYHQTSNNDIVVVIIGAAVALLAIVVVGAALLIKK